MASLPTPGGPRCDAACVSRADPAVPTRLLSPALGSANRDRVRTLRGVSARRPAAETRDILLKRG